jgi:hypothetical protein
MIRLESIVSRYTESEEVYYVGDFGNDMIDSLINQMNGKSDYRTVELDVGGCALVYIPNYSFVVEEIARNQVRTIDIDVTTEEYFIQITLDTESGEVEQIQVSRIASIEGFGIP